MQNECTCGADRTGPSAEAHDLDCPASGRRGFPEQTTMIAIAASVFAARQKHPGTDRMFAALIEEVGEVGKAIVERMERGEVDRELLQTIAVCVRMIEEGDKSHDLQPAPRQPEWTPPESIGDVWSPLNRGGGE